MQNTADIVIIGGGAMGCSILYHLARRDQVPGIDGLFCAVGFSGHGFKLAPAIGQAMAELALDGQATSADLTPLRFSRFAEGDLLNSRYRCRVLA